MPELEEPCRSTGALRSEPWGHVESPRGAQELALWCEASVRSGSPGSSGHSWWHRSLREVYPAETPHGSLGLGRALGSHKLCIPADAGVLCAEALHTLLWKDGRAEGTVTRGPRKAACCLPERTCRGALGPDLPYHLCCPCQLCGCLGPGPGNGPPPANEP